MRLNLCVTGACFHRALINHHEFGPIINYTTRLSTQGTSMDSFRYRDGDLYCEEISIRDIIESVGSPAFIYSKQTFVAHVNAFRQAFLPLAPMLCFSVKSCSNIHLLALLQREGAGMDVVSGGELHRANVAGTPLDRVVFAGVGKSREELAMAVDQGVFLINVESEDELIRLRDIARSRSKRPRVGLRVNPDVQDPSTPSKTSTGGRGAKFGIPIGQAAKLFIDFGSDAHVDLSALHIHLGSPISSAQAYLTAIDKLYELIEEIRINGGRVEVLDFGGGFPAHYDNSLPFDTMPKIAAEICRKLQPLKAQGMSFIAEPGRSICANAGVLIARTEYIKQGWDKSIVVLDVGMNALIRPTLYGAHHFLWPIKFGQYSGSWHGIAALDRSGAHSFSTSKVDIVGPICESGDYLALDREIVVPQADDYIAAFSAGAYAMSMANQYNSRPRPCEVLVDGTEFRIIRRRESYTDLLETELLNSTLS
jgi:diaminopimelate decarboxylase